ncbi:type VI secretion system tube protein Hcp [Herbaspirillum rubrisubalbicans]|uniref:Hcp1 family type VI secretion system effector n=1 Tax=Herbaspirillum rubrisubalbicans TaxID=80842 RepID=A0AAD0U8B6_9BURK|nr:type VI secretion system tube protein Hcp [Herbaspirillum rubrisubalbicans]ALU89494.1 hypothetical protein Hrubri_2309 [Herbaspirillum rubrisubalbicans M1]AYR24573.1 Hcp1 family type VI secretion system effector [Herbaspirillum rubrisubalbicans]
MDLILLQPGDSTVLAGASNWTTAQSSQIASWPSGTAGLPTAPCFEMTSVHFGMKQQMTTDVSNNARTSGRPVITDITCVKYIDNASTLLYDRCLRAYPLGTSAKCTSIFLLRNSGDQLACLMKIDLYNAMVSEIQTQTHPNDMPTEQFKINFTDIMWTYYPQANDTSVGGMLMKGWSVRQNQALSAAPTA